MRQFCEIQVMFSSQNQDIVFHQYALEIGWALCAGNVLATIVSKCYNFVTKM